MSPQIPLSTGKIQTNTCFPWPTQVFIITACRSSQPSLCSSPYSLPILYNEAGHVPLKLPISWGDPGPHLIHGSLGPPESTTQTASWSLQPFLYVWPLCSTDTESHTDRQTHRPLYIDSNRPHIMQPNNVQKCKSIPLPAWSLELGRHSLCRNLYPVSECSAGSKRFHSQVSSTLLSDFYQQCSHIGSTHTVLSTAQMQANVWIMHQCQFTCKFWSKVVIWLQTYINVLAILQYL